MSKSVLIFVAFMLATIFSNHAYATAEVKSEANTVIYVKNTCDHYEYFWMSCSMDYSQSIDVAPGATVPFTFTPNQVQVGWVCQGSNEKDGDDETVCSKLTNGSTINLVPAKDAIGISYCKTECPKN